MLLYHWRGITNPTCCINMTINRITLFKGYSVFPNNKFVKMLSQTWYSYIRKMTFENRLCDVQGVSNSIDIHFYMKHIEMLYLKRLKV